MEQLTRRRVKRALILTTIWYSGFSLLNAFAWDTSSLFATRLLTGVGLSSMTVVAMTYISEMFPAKVRGRYQALILTIGLCGIPVTAYVARFLIPMKFSALLRFLSRFAASCWGVEKANAVGGKSLVC